MEHIKVSPASTEGGGRRQGFALDSEHLLYGVLHAGSLTG